MEGKSCTECGSRLIASQIRADKVRVHYYDSMGGSYDRLGTPFKENGEENMAQLFVCPNLKRHWYGYTRHDSFLVSATGGKHYHPRLV